MIRTRSQFHRNRSGFTLLELLVVGMLGTMVLAVITNVWRWYGHSIREQQTEVLLTQELKIASDAIAQDYGTAIGSRSTDGQSVEFDFDGGAMDGSAQWADPDNVVEYSLDSDKLVRRDESSSASVPLAAHMKSMSIATVNGHLEVTLTVTFRDTDRSITLRLTGT